MTIAPAASTVALAALTLFAAAGLLIGGLLIGGAARVAAVTHGSATGYHIGGGAILLVAALALAWAWRQWGAIRAVDVEDDGTWRLLARGRARATIPPGQPVTIALRGTWTAFSFGAVPRLRDLVEGVLVAGSRRWRLAPSGPVTYDEVLRGLGAHGAAPRRGRATYELRREA